MANKYLHMYTLQAPNGSYSDRNVAAIGEGTDSNGGVSLREVVETEGETPDFDFDAVADDVGMKVNLSFPLCTEYLATDQYH